MRAFSTAVALASALLLISPSWAQAPVPPAPAPSIGDPGPVAPVIESTRLNRDDLEAWLDGYMPYALQRGDIAGAVVVVVKDGDVLLQKGYGHADVARGVRVDPARTLFRAGSVSKPFTATAVMQLVEVGKLDLDRDVNTYLDFKIPPRDGRPITLRHLLTHTAGFEENLKNLISSDPANALPLERYVKGWVPDRIFPAGEVPAYSNYGFALAGYIVQRVSGEPFDDYVARHIFQPLGMTHATFAQPLPTNLAPSMSMGYRLGSGTPQPYEILAPAPAGSLAATGSDMARFMIAHLQDGAYGSSRILQPQTVSRMQRTPLTVVPTVNRMLLGFFESNRNGRKIIAHRGDTEVFHSAMHLFIDDGVGLYVAMNSDGKDGTPGAIRRALFEQFADRYLPGPHPEGKIDHRTSVAHARLIAGLYESSRRSESNFPTLIAFLGQVKMVARPDGTIRTSELEGLNGEPKTWREIAPFVWRDVDGEDRLAAKVVNGRVAMFSTDQTSAYTVFQPVPWWKSSAWLTLAAATSVAALALTALSWPVVALIRWRYGAPFSLAGIDARAHRAIRLAAVAILAVAGAWAAMFTILLSDLTVATSALDGWLLALQTATAAALVGGAGVALWNAWVVWTRPRGWFAKAWSAVLVPAALTALWGAVALRLVSFSANY
jgi:CubicO group peptidase (beta-lactamase class C family)